MLLSGLLVGDSRRLLIFFAGSCKSVKVDQDTDAVLEDVKYESVASILRQFDLTNALSLRTQSYYLTVNRESYGSALKR